MDVNWSYGPRGCRSDETRNADVQPVRQGSNTFTYDSVGRLASETTSAGTTTYNDENELTGISGTSPTAPYTYDGNGQRAWATRFAKRTGDDEHEGPGGPNFLQEACLHGS